MKDLDASAVDLLLIVGGNPVFNAPVEMGLRDRIQRPAMRVHLSLYEDETSAVCQWHLPETHYLETWGDARAFDGTVTIQQPLIQPLYGGRSAYRAAAVAHRLAGLRTATTSSRATGPRSTRAPISKPGGGARCTMALWPARRCPEDSRAERRPPSATGRSSANWTARSKSSSGPIRRSTTGASPTTAGCRSCPSPSPSSPGTTPPS